MSDPPVVCTDSPQAATRPRPGAAVPPGGGRAAPVRANRRQDAHDLVQVQMKALVMNPPSPTERVITERVRIEELITTHLKAVAVSPDGWEKLYLDPGDGRLWELTYPQAEMHGGGPPELREMDGATATARYGYAR